MHTIKNNVTHSSYLRVRYADTDCAGVVYHSNYLIYFEVGRTDLMREYGISYSKLEQDYGLVLAVVDAQATFRSPAVYDDYLRIDSSITKYSGTRVHFDYTVSRDSDDTLLCRGYTVLAAVKNGKPVRLPQVICDVCNQPKA